MVYYDANPEVTEGLEMMTIASWKSYKLKRCTVNTLSAECQSMIQGVGNLHWHRFLMTEIMGSQLQLETWEKELRKTLHRSDRLKVALRHHHKMQKYICTRG